MISIIISSIFCVTSSASLLKNLPPEACPSRKSFLSMNFPRTRDYQYVLINAFNINHIQVHLKPLTLTSFSMLFFLASLQSIRCSTMRDALCFRWFAFLELSTSL